MDQYEALKFSQLSVANKSSVLLFTKDKFSQLGKKLRPEFEKFYVSSELKDCLKLLGNSNESGSGAEPTNAVDMVLADYDTSAIRLVDFVNKRTTNPLTKACPHIPIIVLLHESNEREAMEHLRGAGGVTKIVMQPFQTKDLLYTMIDVLSTQKKVEDTFRSLTRKKIISSKYPYLPIFDKVNSDETAGELDEKTRGAVSRRPTRHEVGIGHSASGSVGGPGHEQKVEEVEDGTDCSSLLPEFVRRIRAESPELNSPYRAAQRKRTDTEDFDADEERLHAEAAEREAWRARQHAKSVDDMSLESSVGHGDHRPGELLLTDETNHFVDGKLLGSVDALADAFNYSSSSLDKSSIASMVRKHVRAEELGAGGQHSVVTSSTTSGQNKAQELLSNKLRPVWSDFKTEVLTEKKPIAPVMSVSKSRKSQKMGFTHVYDLHPFVMKPPPLIQRPSTVGGLDKRTADNYWKAYKPRAKDAVLRKETKQANFTTSESLLDLPTIEEHGGHGGPHRAGTKGSIIFTPQGSPSGKNFGHFNFDLHGSFDASSVMKHAALGSHSFDSNNGSVEHLNQSDKMVRRLSQPGFQPLGSGSHYSGASRDSGSNAINMSPSKAEKKIQELANECSPDLAVSILTDIDFNNRKINLGEKEMLLKGMRVESDGDLEGAISFYTRAGMHSKDPQIAKMLIGNLHYKSGKTILALNLYTAALQILSSRQSSNRSLLDEFIAHRNRGIINFRLGDDTSGLHDIEKAVKLRPQDIELRELISLVKRRMGRYGQAIQEATVAKTIRNENKRTEQMQAQQKDIIRKKKFLKAERERNRQKVSGAVVYNESAQFIHFPGRSSRHASVHVRPIEITASGDESVTSSEVPNGSALVGGLFNDSNNKDEDINTRLLQTRGYVLNIEDSACQNSLRERVKASRKMVKVDANNDEHNSHDTFLRIFKMNNGYKADLFKDIFEKPSELQTALLVHPEQRGAAELSVIATALKLFPLIAPLSDSKIYDLAKVLEYRALTMKDTIFSQNDQASAVCFLLSGQIQVKMEKQSAGHSTIDINIGEVPEYTAFGHIDFLFRNNNPRIMQEVEAVIKPRKPKPHAMSTHQAHMNTLLNNTLGLSGSNSKPSSPHVMHRKEISLHVTAIEEGNEDGDDGSSLGIDDNPLLLHAARSGMPLDRSLSPGMFTTYAIQSMCEMLMLRDIDFEKCLLAPALENLRVRLDVIRSCGIFNDWTVKQHVRLARMGQIKRVRKGETILAQGTKPNYLYIIMKGICVVRKQPNRTEMLVQKLTVAKEKANEFDSKYIFDHKLCDVLKMANLKEEFKVGNMDQADINSTLADFKRNPESILRHRNVTVSELDRYKLQLEINKLESLIASAEVEDERERNSEMFNNLAASKKYTTTAAAVAAAATAAANLAASRGIPVLEEKVAEIASIQWPKIFGEACIVDPEEGRSRGSIVADTACEIFMLHKTQIQTFAVDDLFLKSVKIKAVAYPGDPEVVVSLFRNQGWKKYRAELLEEIPKDRWPMNETNIKEPFRIN